MTVWDGAEYQARFDRLAATGVDMHGEASFVMRLGPTTVLDAGCGTGRVAVELARRGARVVGVDVSESMLDTARRADPEIEWIEADLVGLDLGRTFGLVVMAGNVPLFTAPGTEAELVGSVATHVAPGGHLVAGFSTNRSYALASYDDHAGAAGLVLVERWSTWDHESWDPSSTYAVSVHVRPG